MDAYFYNCFCRYSTGRILRLKSKPMALFYRFLQFAIWVYIIVWLVIARKGYQKLDSVESSVTVKLKGIARTNTSDLGVQIWDVADFIIPSPGKGGFFVTTNVIFTRNQKQGLCPMFPHNHAICKSARDCLSNFGDVHSEGIQTGRCVPYNITLKTCELFAWCPVENDTSIPKSNILPTLISSRLSNCLYHEINDPFCPIFRLGQIVKDAQNDFQEMAIQGGLVAIQINWDCNLDFDESSCLPKYTFRRLDSANNYSASPGYNFRYARYYKDLAGHESRTLMKVYGIRFDVVVYGTAGKADIVQTVTSLGSACAFFGVASFLCELLLACRICAKSNKTYTAKKFKSVDL